MSYKGTSWKKHKYVKKFNNRYYYSLDEYMKRHKAKLDNDIEKEKTKLEKRIKKSEENIDTYVENAANNTLKIKIPPINVKKMKLEPEIMTHGKEYFNKSYKYFKSAQSGFDYAVNMTSDNTIKGIKCFNRLIAKIF